MDFDFALFAPSARWSVALDTSQTRPPADRDPLAAARPSARPGFWATLSATFTTILLAEMGDKTQLATLLIAAESQAPWVVFAGAALALVSTSLIGVLLGWWLSRRVSQQAMDLGAATILLLLAVLLLWDVV